MMAMKEKGGRAEAAAELHHVTHPHAADGKPIVIYPTGQQENDYWECRGQNGIWRRKHNKSRLALFTPYRVPRGPPKSCRLMMLRKTVGVFDDGEKFTHIDNWNATAMQHKVLDRSWTGYTEMYVENDEQV